MKLVRKSINLKNLGDNNENYNNDNICSEILWILVSEFARIIKIFLGWHPRTPPSPSASLRPCEAHYGPQKKFTFKSCPHTLLTLYTALYKEHKCILHMTCNKSIFYRCLLNGFNTMVELIRNGNMFEIYGNIFEIYGNTFENHGMKFWKKAWDEILKLKISDQFSKKCFVDRTQYGLCQTPLESEKS